MPRSPARGLVNVVPTSTVGVPVIFPALSLSPRGSEPSEMANLYGGVPPVAWIEAEYALPIPTMPIPMVASGKEVVDIFRQPVLSATSAALVQAGPPLPFVGVVAVVVVNGAAGPVGAKVAEMSR